MLFFVNLVGGIAVLASYAHGIATHDRPGEALWGGVPSSLRPAYAVGMCTATVGYLVLLFYLALRWDPSASRGPSWLGAGAFAAIFALVLVPSSLWMPLTFAYLDRPTPLRWIAVRAVLLLVAAGSLLLVAALVAVRPETGKVAWALGVAGSVAFALHVTVLDAFVWTAFFRR